MRTTDLLELAQQKMKEIEEILDEVQTNESLDDYYGYSINIIKQELKKSNNGGGFLTSDKSIEDIIYGEGEKWNDEEHEVEEEDYTENYY